MIHVDSDSSHGIVSVRVSGHTPPEAVRNLALELEEGLAQHSTPGLLLQLQPFSDRHAEDTFAEALFKLLTVDLTRDNVVACIAVVGASSWKDSATGVLRPVEGKVRYFTSSQLREAWRWLHRRQGDVSGNDAG